MRIIALLALVFFLAAAADAQVPYVVGTPSDAGIYYTAAPDLVVHAHPGQRFTVVVSSNFDEPPRFESTLAAKGPLYVRGLGFPTPLRSWMRTFTADRAGRTSISWKCEKDGRVTRQGVITVEVR